jgi:hypothetical protein
MTVGDGHLKQPAAQSMERERLVQSTRLTSLGHFSGESEISAEGI